MGYTPLFVGETRKPLSATFKDDSGAAIDLTNATITARFGGVDGSTSFAGTGTVNVTNAAGGLFTYTFSATDVGTAGNWRLQFKADYGSGSVLFSDPIQIEILADI